MSVTLDERGQRCPMPVIALARAALAAAPGSLIVVISDDPGSIADIPAWCSMRGATLEGVDVLEDGARAFRVRTAS